MLNGTSTKTCRKCGSEKPATEFHRHAASRDGLHSYCKPCNIAQASAGKKRLRREIPGRRHGSAWVIGDVFGELTVIGISRPDGQNALLECKCSCGATRGVWSTQAHVMAYWDCGDANEHYRPPTPAELERKQRCVDGGLTDPSDAPCPMCGGEMTKKSKLCLTCYRKNHTIRADDDVRVKRWHRDRDAPGLKQHERSKLLHEWQTQGRMCIYCGIRKAEAVDHVVPLVRGGDNNEGNLAPCCHACNSMKGPKLVAEWRHDVRVGKQQHPAEWQWRPEPPKPQPKREPIKPIVGEQATLFTRICPACGTAYFGNAAYCTMRCHARSAYRIKVGIPVNAPLYASSSA